MLLPLLALAAAATVGEARAADADPFGAGMLSAIGAPAADPVTGLATAMVPLEVPPGRHGLAPALALRYSSAGGPGNAGLGFGLAIGSIERSTRLGPPRFDDTDTFVLNIDGSSWDLVPIDAGSTRFRTILATGWLVERVRPGPWGLASAQFVARDRDGRRYRFGSAAGIASTSQVADFKWGLDRVEDASGNVMEIGWATTGRQLYPVRIDYASHPATGLPATNVVELCWEERGDRPPSPSGEVLTHRLHEVRTFAGPLPVRRFTFTYASVGSLASPLGTCRSDIASPGPVNSVPGPTTNPGPAQPPSAPRLAPSDSESTVASSPPPLTKIGKASPLPGVSPAPVSVQGTSDEPAGITTDDVAAPPSSLPAVPSLLVRIDRADGSGALLPPIDYAYGATGGPSWPAAGNAGLVPPVPFLYAKSDADEDSGARLVDLNRDGLPDVVLLEGRLSGFSASTTAAAWLNTGQAFQYSAAWSAALLALAQSFDSSRNAWFVIKRDTRDRVDNGVRFVDVNDDGRIDVLRSVIWFGSGVRKEIFLNTGSGFTGDVASSYLLPDEPFVDLQAEGTRDVADDRGVRLADLDADGRTDLVVARAEWGAISERRVYRNGPGGFSLDTRFLLPDEPFVRHIPHGHSLDTGLRLMELNGDGFPDLFRAANVDGLVSTATYLHNGPPDGVHPTWTKTAAWGFLGTQAEHFVQISSAGDGSVLDRGLRVADVDGDGKSDIVIGRRWNGGPVERFLFSPAPTGEWRWHVLPELPWIFVDRVAGEASRDQGVRLADLDGDGGVDLLLVPDVVAPAWRPNTAWRGRPLLASCSNGLGGRIELTYAPAPHTGVLEGGGAAELPFPFPVVSELRLSDGLGQTLATRFDYSGGFYHHARRELRGFRQVITTHPGGALRTESLFVQQPLLAQAPLRGVVAERLERRVSDGALLSRTVRTFDQSDRLPPLRHPIVREETRFFDWGTSDAQSTAWTRRVAVSWTYQFDETAGPEQPLLRSDERREGDTADPSDDRIVRTEYASLVGADAAGAASTAPWRLEEPWHESTLGASGDVAGESWTAWDDAPLGTAGARGLPTRLERRGGSPGAPGAHGPGDPENPVTRRSYDDYGNLETETDPLGATRRFGHGGAQDPTCTFPVSETDPLGRTSTRRFDPRTGLMTESVDPNGRSIVIEYDGFGRRLAEWGPGDTRERPTVSYLHEIGAVPSRVRRFARETSGQGERAGTAGCLESVAYYDGLGRLLEVAAEHAAGRIVTGAVTWDAAGRVARRAEPFLTGAGASYVSPASATAAVLFEYDAAGRLLRTTDAAGQVTTDEPGSVVAARVDPLGHRIETTLDAEGRAVMVQEFEGVGGAAAPRPPARYRYDAAGRLVEITDPMGAMTRLQYDLLGRRLSLDDPHIGSWRSAYDLGSRLVEETDPQGRVTRLSWDLLGRITGKTLADGRRFEWRYDEGGAAAGALGRLTTISDPTGTERFTYDALGRVTEASRTLFGTTFTATTAWDAMGRITARTLPGAVHVEFHYDAGGRIASVDPWIPTVGTDARGTVNDLLYLGGNRLTRATDPATGRLLSIHGTGPGGGTLVDLGYRYDADGLISAIDDRTDPLAVITEQYTYDGRHRLTQAAGPFGTLHYDYDDGGTIRLKEGITLSAGNPAQPQRLVWTSAGDTFDYDAAGNLTLRSRPGADRRLAYDAAGRLVRLEEPARSLVVTSDYDASGQLVREATTEAGRSTTVLFPFPGVEVQDGRITTNIFLGTLRALVIGPDGTVYHPMSDALGSARVIVSRTGQVIARARYRPYGDGQGAELSDPISSLRYAGVHRQSASGLLVMGWRHYDPAYGRFLEPDPLVAAPLDPQALNRYAYARDNPVNLVDPNGHNPFLLLGILGAFALLDRDTRADAATSVAVTAASIVLTGLLGPGGAAGVAALRASTPALYAAAATSILMHTPLGQGIVDGYASLLEDLGVSPRASQGIASAGTAFLLNSHLQRSYATALARNGTLARGEALGDRAHLDQALDDRDLDPATFGTRAGDAYGTTVLDRSDTTGRELDRFYELRDGAGRVPGVFGVRELHGGFEHGAAAIAQPGATTVIETHHHFLYLFGGISTQQVARDLFESGYSASLFTLTGRASDFMIEYFYGPYGGGLFFGLDVALSGQNSGEDP